MKFSGSSAVLEPVKLGGFILKNHESLKCQLFLSRTSLLPGLVTHSLAQHPDSLIELNISDFSLRWHFRCIR
ncbi:hypothetical protein H5410_036534 [Solanum commersonii]|uniref:Uncharacterized protein n=1 Tax=Solanum commersonii TaxID=4109 RepID=A0A9J5Y8G0_SOLCO|nr:hypothetical protein H5410_036534 [Solanum commersonii]